MDLLDLGELQVPLQQSVAFSLVHLLQKIGGAYKNRHATISGHCPVPFPCVDLRDQLIRRNRLKQCHSFQINCWL